MNTITIINADNGIETLTPDEFAAKYLPRLIERDAKLPRPDDYYVRNTETGKVELHVTKPAYTAFTADEKQSIWDLFRWSRNDNCWISRGLPNEGLAALVEFAQSIGLPDGNAFAALESARADVIAPVEKKAATKATRETQRPKIIPDNIAKPGKPITSDIIESALRKGSGFAEGKIRIAAYYASTHTPDEGKKFLREEYGTGGGTHYFPDGTHGWVDSDGSGFTITHGDYSSGKQTKLSWLTVDSYLRDMVKEGRYLTDEEQTRYNAIAQKYKGKMPAPHPRMAYPPEKMGA